MAHGYLGDGYGKYGDRDPDGGRDDDRRDWRGQDRGDWRGEDRGDWRDRQDRGDRGSDRGRFMFEGGGRERGWDRSNERGGNHDRGFFERTRDEARDWFRDDDRDDRSRGQDRYSREQPRNERSAFSSPEHADYLNWRQQQIDALDRDYQDYCRERQQQFHSDFNSWRQNRQSNSPTSQSGQQQPSGAQATELELSERDELEGTTNARSEPQATVSPESAATLGSNNSENAMPGRR